MIKHSRPKVGSQVIRDTDPLQRVGVVIKVTETENAIRYIDSTEVFDGDVPFTYVGWSNPTSWHPFANRYRMMNEEEIARTVKSVSKRQRFPIIIGRAAEDGPDAPIQLIDGRNRLLCAHIAGVDPWIEEEYFLTHEEIDAYVQDVNDDRRMLSKEDRIQMAADRAEELRILGNKRKRLNAMKSSPETKPANAGFAFGKESADIAGKEFGLSGDTVQRELKARKQEKQLLEANRSDLVEKVRAGKMGLTPALIEAGIIQAPSKIEGNLEVSVSFLKKHYASFQSWAKDNDVQFTKEK